MSKEIIMKYMYIHPNEENPNKIFYGMLVNDEKDEENNSKIVIDLNKQKFSHEYNNTVYDFFYKISISKCAKSYTISFHLPYKNKKEQHMHAFSSLISYINKQKKTDFYLISIKDDVSEYYSNRLYKSLARYERNMRSLILAIFVPKYRENWHEDITGYADVEFKGNVKDKVEKGLEELDLSNLESIFFDRKLNITNENYLTIFSKEEIQALEKEEIIELIEEYKPVSVWEKYLNEKVTIDNIEKRMEVVRKLRNKIAHNKTFTQNNYKGLNKELNDINPKVEEAIEMILYKPEKIDISNLINSIASQLNEQLKESLNPIIQTSNQLKEFFKPIIQTNKQLKESFKPIIQTNKQLKESFKPIVQTNKQTSEVISQSIRRGLVSNSEEDEDEKE